MGTLGRRGMAGLGAGGGGAWGARSCAGAGAVGAGTRERYPTARVDIVS